MFFFSQKFIPHIFFVKILGLIPEVHPETDAPCFYHGKKQLEWCLKCPFWCWWIDECFLALFLLGLHGLRFTTLVGCCFWAFHQPCQFDMQWLRDIKLGRDRFGAAAVPSPCTVFTHPTSNDSDSPTSNFSVMKLAFVIFPQKKGGKKNTTIPMAFHRPGDAWGGPKIFRQRLTTFIGSFTSETDQHAMGDAMSDAMTQRKVLLMT